MMRKIHYYFGWFNGVIPQKIAQSLNGDISDKKSLAIITTAPSNYEYTDGMLAFTKDTWFESAGVFFGNYHSIDYRITKEEAHTLLKSASAILLHGGYPDELKFFIEEYELAKAIEESAAAVIMGASAGGMNMSAKFAYGKKIDDDLREPTIIYDGLSLDSFALQSHAIDSLEGLARNEHVKNYLFPLSYDIDVYVACEESTIRTESDKFDVMGSVYLISNSHIQKVEETFWGR